MAFISNPEEEKLLVSEAYQAKIAASLARGIDRFRKSARPGRAGRGRLLAGRPVTPRQANVLTAVGLAGLLATVALTAPRWAALLRAPAASPEVDEPAVEETASPVAEGPAAEAGRRISVRLYFEAPDREGLLPEEREVAFSARPAARSSAP